MSLQLALNLSLQPALAFHNFIPGGNQEALNAVQGLAASSGEPYLYLWGPAGVGKSHLLQAACSLAHGPEQPVAYLPLEPIENGHPRMLEDLDRMRLVCLDDVQALAGQPDWEGALFTLFNRLREHGGRLLVSADRPLGQLPIRLPDLASRLAWGPSYHLHPLSHGELLPALTRLAAERGLDLPPDSARYLLYRCPRNLGYLQRLLAHLDRASLAAQRRLTLPFVREALGQWEATGAAPPPPHS